MIADLILNLALLVALSVISSFLVQHWKAETPTGALLQGLLFGGAAVIGMMRPMVLGPGLIFDGRSIMISLCTYFFGPWSALPAILGPGLYRLHLGGSGALMGVLVVFSSATIGLLAHRWRPPSAGPVPALRLYGLGLLVNSVMVSLMVFLPAGLGLATLRRIGPTILILYPLATVLAGKILADREALHASEARFRSLFENSHAVMLVIDPETGAVIDGNPAAVAYYGWSREDLLRRSIWDINLLPREEVIARMRAARGRTQSIFQNRHRLATGSERDVEVYSGPVQAGSRQLLFSIVVDITERRLAEQAREESLREKEALLKEVHHRVKNNLQVVVSLLRLESVRHPESEVAAVLGTMVGRIRSMALLHESIYRSENLASVDLATYLRRIATHLWRASPQREERVTLQLNLSSVRLEVDQALPCGLIVNELAANSLKHAFPGDRHGRVSVVLRPDDDGHHIRLEVSDDGVGLPPDFEALRTKSLGLNLVSDLCRQVGGELKITTGPAGACFAVTFTPKLERAAAPERFS